MFARSLQSNLPHRETPPHLLAATLSQNSFRLLNNSPIPAPLVDASRMAFKGDLRAVSAPAEGKWAECQSAGQVPQFGDLPPATCQRF